MVIWDFEIIFYTIVKYELCLFLGKNYHCLGQFWSVLVIRQTQEILRIYF